MAASGPNARRNISHFLASRMRLSLTRIRIVAAVAANRSMHHSRDLHVNAIQAWARGDEQSLPVRPSEREICGTVSFPNRSQVLPFGRDNPNSAGPRAVNVPLHVDLYTVRKIRRERSAAV